MPARLPPGGGPPHHPGVAAEELPSPPPGAVDMPAQPGRRWVWHATLASRAAGQVSVLACMETLFAVALYW